MCYQHMGLPFEEVSIPFFPSILALQMEIKSQLLCSGAAQK